MLKRIFRLAVLGLAGWLAWIWLRRRQHEFADHAPQFAPRPPAVPPPTPAASAYERADDDQVVPLASAPLAPLADAPAAPAEPLAAPYERADDDQVVLAEPAAPAAEQAASGGFMGYCVRCRTKRPIQGAELTTSESGRRAARGTCPVCGAKMYTFLAADE